MRKDKPRKVLPFLIIHVAAMILASVLVLHIVSLPPSVVSAETQGLLRETAVGGVVVSIAPVVENGDSGVVTLKAGPKDIFFSLFLIIGFLGVTVGGGWACFLRTRTGSNWRLVGAILIFASLLASPLSALLGIDMLRRGSVQISAREEGVQLTARTWGATCIDRIIPSESDPRIVLYPRADRSSSDKVALVWSTESGVEALWIFSFSGEADPRAGKFVREISRASGLPFQVQRRDEEPE